MIVVGKVPVLQYNRPDTPGTAQRILFVGGFTIVSVKAARIIIAKMCRLNKRKEE